MFISMNKIEVTWKLDPTFISLRIVLLFTGNSEFHHFGVFKPVIKILAIYKGTKNKYSNSRFLANVEFPEFLKYSVNNYN